MSIPIKRESYTGLVCCVGKTKQASKSSCEKVYEEEDGIYHRTTEYEKETVKKSFHEEARTMSKTPNRCVNKQKTQTTHTSRRSKSRTPGVPYRLRGEILKTRKVKPRDRPRKTFRVEEKDCNRCQTVTEAVVSGVREEVSFWLHSFSESSSSSTSARSHR